MIWPLLGRIRGHDAVGGRVARTDVLIEGAADAGDDLRRECIGHPLLLTVWCTTFWRENAVGQLTQWA